MATVSPDRMVVFIPRWRLFAYRAAGWTVRGSLSAPFLEVEWRRKTAPVFLSTTAAIASAGATGRDFQRL